MPVLSETGQQYFRIISKQRRNVAKAEGIKHPPERGRLTRKSPAFFGTRGRAARAPFTLRLRVFALKMGVLVFLNGQFMPEVQAVVPVSDRGFLLGDGLFETVRVANGKPFRIAQHLDRLARGAGFFKIKMPFSSEQLQEFAARLITQNQMPEAVLRLTLTRGSGGRGYAPNTNAKPTVVMTLHPAPGAPASGPASSGLSSPLAGPEAGAPLGWNLITSSFRIPAGDPLAAFKTTSKILHVMARAEAVERGADEALLLNTNGKVAETAGGNIFWVSDGNICTVPAGHGILPGVTRAVVLEICRTLGLPVSECVIKPEDLKNSKGVFITQSVLGIVPVTVFDGKQIAPSPLVDQIVRAYCDLLFRP
jgi:branched-chain amino acid aminotransferase